MGKEGNNHWKSARSFLSFLTCPPPKRWCITHPLPQGPLSEPQSDQKCNQDNQNLLSRTFHGERGKQSPEIYHLFNPPDFSHLFSLLGWHITHPSPQGSLSEPGSDQKCHQDNQILLSRPFHRERGEQLPGIYHLPGLSDLPYLISLLGWYITHPLPQGPL